jgi:tetratricopeptide (TPR) repeat protein
VDPNAFNWYSHMLASVGRLDASLEQALIALELEPTSAVLNSRVALAHLWLGDNENAGVFFERARKYGATGRTHLMGYALFLSRTGRIEEASAMSEQAAEVAGASPDWTGPFFAAMDDPALRPQAVAAIDAGAAAGEVTKQVEFMARVLLEDLDGALRVAQGLEQPGEIFEMDLLFIPEAERLRAHPGFGELMTSLGVREYWNDRGCEWTGNSVRCDSGQRD